MHFPFLVAAPRSGLQYRPTESTLAELLLAPLPGEWAPGPVIADAPDPVWADSLANAPGETIAAVMAALEDLVLATPDLRPPAVDQLPDSRARRHLAALVNLWTRLGDALPPGLAPVRHVLELPEGRFLDPLPVVTGSLDQHAPTVIRALYARLEREFGAIETTASPHVARDGSRLQALQAGITAPQIAPGDADDSLAFYGLRDAAACAEFAAARARALMDAGTPAREIAVLAASETGHIARAFAAQGVPLSGVPGGPPAPQRDPVPGVALEVLPVVKGRGVKKFSKPQEHIAERIARILHDKETVTDRHTKVAREVRPSDIALLVRRHATAANYAAELRARGAPVRIAEDGWASSPAVQAARAALGFAANPADIHAALVLRTLGPDPVPLQEALAAQIEGRLLDDPLLMRLAGLADGLRCLPVSSTLDLVLDAAGLHDWAAARDDAGQARADLLRLVAEAVEFETAHRDLKAASGFHGESAKVFLGWLDARADEQDFDRHPDPSANTAEAIEIVTWHSSKGREWPITVVAEFDAGIEEWPLTTSVQFEALGRTQDMTEVLASAQLIHTPVLAAPEAARRFIEDRRADFEADARNLLYVALTRARDRLVIEWPGFLKGREPDEPASRLFHVFEDTCAPQITADGLRITGVECAAKVTPLPEIASLTEYDPDNRASLLRFGAPEPLPPVELTPWRLQPSQIVDAGPAPASRSVRIGPTWPSRASDTTRGTALHLALRTCLTRPDLAPSLPAATGLDAATLALVAERAAALKAWLTAEGYTDLRCEIPVPDHTADGAEISGTVDLLATGPNGACLIDHKTGGSGRGFGPYWPQLATYIDLLRDLFPAQSPNRVALFWLDHGVLEVADVAGFAQAEASLGAPGTVEG